MDVSGLLPLVRAARPFQDLAARLRHGRRHRVGLPDAAKPIVEAAIAAELAGPLLIVVPTLARARNLVDGLRAWLGPSRVVEHFAERDGLPHEALAMDVATVQARQRALAALATERAPIVVTTGRALMDRLAAPADYQARFIELARGGLGDPSALASQLYHAGYQPTPLVEEPSSFSRRGGIVDVFPPTSPEPLRIEYFGDEIDTIRAFDPATQRSRAAVERVVLPPASELFPPPAAEVIAELQRLDLTTMTEAALAGWRRDLDRVANGEASDLPAALAGYLGDAGLLDYLPADGLLLIEEPESVAAGGETIEEQAGAYYDEQVARGALPAGLRAPFRGWDALRAALAARDGADLTWQAGPGEIGEAAGTALAPDEIGLGAIFRVATAYGGRLRVAIDDVQAALDQRRRVVIVTRQDGRLAELFGERDITATLTTEIREPPPPGSLTLVHGGLGDGFQIAGDGQVDLVFLTDLEIFGWAKPRRPVRARSTARDTFLSDLAPGDYIVHVEHGVGRYAGLVRLSAMGAERDYLQIDYAESDRLFVPIDQADRVGRYIGVGDNAPALHRLSGTEWERTKARVKAAVQAMARELLALYAAREVAVGHTFAPDSTWQHELEASFPYVETPDQLAALEAVKQDMEQPRPMDRLLCADVGYGKTEIALRAAFKAVMDGKQVAVLVPTTVLAQQHFATFRERMQAFPVRIEMLSRFRSPREQRAVAAGLRAGTIDICIGTHRLLQKDIEFKDLGLVVIDEEQRFGVAHKERMKQLRQEVDVLTLTATPIPRTLHMALAGVRDMSTMESPPEDRLPIRTYVQPWNDNLVREAIERELDRGGQVFVVHNRVQTIYQQAQRLQALVPRATILVGHGQLEEDKLERVMVDFAAGQADVLVCTTIIESGVDIPNVNTIIVNNADTFGLAQLYQLRGRVGRGANRAFAYLLYRRGAQLSEVAEKRLRAIFEATELGSGFQIAMKDLEIRGAGNLLGAEQSGNVAAVGFQLYTDLLAEAVATLRGQPVEPTKPEPTLDVPVNAFIPTDYVEDEAARLSIYRRLAAARTMAQVGAIVDELRDRYGAPPVALLELIWLVQIKALAMAADVHSIVASENMLVVRFLVEKPERLRALEPRYAPHLRVSRSFAYFDMVGLGPRWQEVLERFLEAVLQPSPRREPVRQAV